MPVLTSVSQATRPFGSSARIASGTPSEIWWAPCQGVGPVAGDQLAVVDLDRDPRRAHLDLRRVVEPQPAATFGGRRRLADHFGDEPVQFRGRDPRGGAV